MVQITGEFLSGLDIIYIKSGLKNRADLYKAGTGARINM